MPSEDGNCSNTAAGQKRSGALELGPRKKPYVTFLRQLCNLTLTLPLAVIQIHLYTTAGILDGQSMPYVPSAPF